MAVPTAITDLSATLASNSPAGGDQAFPYVDDYLRAAYGFIRQGDTKASDIASAATTDIGAAVGRIVDVTGTTTIMSFGTVAAGIWRIVRFTGALTLTHNATSLILPGGVNITTAAGDCLTAVSLGSGNWVVTDYQPGTCKFIAAHTSSSVTVADSQTVLTFTTETYDAGGHFASSTFTAPRAGLYLFQFVGHMLFGTGSTEGSVRFGFINASNSYTTSQYVSRYNPYAADGFYVPIAVQAILSLAAGDTVRVAAQKDASVTDTVSVPATRWFSGVALP